MIVVLFALIVAQAFGLWLLATLWGDARHRANRAEASEAKLRARLSQREPRRVVRVSAMFPAELPAQRALPPARGDEPDMAAVRQVLAVRKALDGVGWPAPPPPPNRPRDVIDVPAWTEEIPVVSFDDIDGGTREFRDREAWTANPCRRGSRVPADQTITRVRHGLQIGLWDWVASWWPGAVTHA